jgi:hypothetical protein
MPINNDNPDEEAIEDDKNNAGNPEGDIDRKINGRPIGSDVGEPPGTEQMKKNGEYG